MSALVVCKGDSITEGLGVAPAQCFVACLAAALGRRAGVLNRGRSGERAAEMAARARSEIDPLFDPGRARNVVVFLAGTNDLFAGAAAPEVERSIGAFCRGRRAAGFDIVLATVLPNAALTASAERERCRLNAALAAGWHGYADVVADLAAAPDIADPALYLDGVHPSPEGHARIAALLAPVIAPLLP